MQINTKKRREAMERTKTHYPLESLNDKREWKAKKMDEEKKTEFEWKMKI